MSKEQIKCDDIILKLHNEIKESKDMDLITNLESQLSKDILNASKRKEFYELPLTNIQHILYGIEYEYIEDYNLLIREIIQKII